MKSVMGVLSLVAFVLSFVGAVNWGLVGGFDYNLVTTLISSHHIVKIVYDVIGVAGVFSAFVFFKHCSKCGK